uniref:Pseudouridine synthase RsuA/RluA-like domain-containing protein n=1 Tax=Panagrolaimus sp. JU765 TaxID=591449 RepID=A0AC34QKQ5_9BILA
MKNNEKRKFPDELGPIKKKQKNSEVEELEEVMWNNVPYIVKDGLRHLTPYWTSYKTWTKHRWLGRTFEEVFSKEFLSTNKNYARVACRLGRIYINGTQMTNPNHILNNNERIVHIGHRHEHPILDYSNIEVIADTDDIFVINKPASIPVHACGQYKFHTILALLEKEKGIKGLRVVHRLDRATSGVLIFAKTYEADVELKQSLIANDWKKEYICRVVGEFPNEEIECNEPIGTLSLSMGIQCIKNDGKDAKSKFQRLWTNGQESLVLCKIATGRTHQIRVHLQWLGYPIISDTIYNRDEWGPNRGKNAEYGKSFEQLQTDVQNAHRGSTWKEITDPEYNERMEKMANDPELKPDSMDMTKLLDLPEYDPICLGCHVLKPDSMDMTKLLDLPEYDPICLGCHVVSKIPPMDHLRLHLHCWRYETSKGTFIASLPEWASEIHESDKKRFISC